MAVFPSSLRSVACAASVALLAGCGGGEKNDAAGRAACADGRAALPRIGPVRRLADVAPSLRKVIGVERRVLAAVGDGDPLTARLRVSVASAERTLAQIERTDPLGLQTMSPLRTGVPDARRSVETARALLEELCSGT